MNKYLQDMEVSTPLPESVIPFVYFGITITSICLLCNLVVIYAIAKQKSIPNDSKFILSLILGDFIFSTSEFVEAIKAASNGMMSNVKTGCLIGAGVILISIGIGIYSLLALTIHRYLVIVKRRSITPMTCIYMIAGIWIFVISMVGAYMLSDLPKRGIAWQSGRLVCSLDWTSKEVALIAINLFAIASIIFPSIIMSVVYFIIVRLFFKIQEERFKKENHGLESSDPGPKDEKEKKISLAKRHAQTATSTRRKITSDEKLLIKKAIAFTVCYITGWIPYLFKIAYEMTTQTAISPLTDQVCTILTMWNPIANTILLFNYDAKVRRNIKELFQWGIIKLIRSKALSPSSPTGLPPGKVKGGKKNQIQLVYVDASKKTEELPTIVVESPVNVKTVNLDIGDYNERL